MSFGYALRRFREERKLSLREFGKLCEIDHAYICRLEKEEKTAPSDQAVEAFVRVLKIDNRRRQLLRWLVGQTVPKQLIDIFVEDSQYNLDLFLPLTQMSFRGRRPQTKDDWREQAKRLETFMAEHSES